MTGDDTVKGINMNNSAPAPTADPDNERIQPFLTVIQSNLKARWLFYNLKGNNVGDCDQPCNIVTALNMTIFPFVIQLAPSLTFAKLMDR